jgi:hypothetical protein
MEYGIATFIIGSSVAYRSMTHADTVDIHIVEIRVHLTEFHNRLTEFHNRLTEFHNRALLIEEISPPAHVPL